ncbi:unnamed protein product, partial [Didymodactylos carnosus]
SATHTSTIHSIETTGTTMDTCLIMDSTITAVSHPGPTSYEAESPTNLITNDTELQNCSDCSGGFKIGFIGFEEELTFENINGDTGGTFPLTIYFATGEDRVGDISINNGAPIVINYYNTSSFVHVNSTTVSVVLCAGSKNTIKFYNPTNYTADIDRIVV